MWGRTCGRMRRVVHIVQEVLHLHAHRVSVVIAAHLHTGAPRRILPVSVITFTYFVLPLPAILQVTNPPGEPKQMERPFHCGLRGYPLLRQTNIKPGRPLSDEKPREYQNKPQACSRERTKMNTGT